MKIGMFVGDYFFLSNFYYAPIEVDGLVFSTVEHAYQWHKTADQAWKDRIRTSPYPGQAKKLGRLAPMVEDWDQIKFFIMARLVNIKFNQHLDLREKLAATEDAVLEEGNSWGDSIWGVDITTGQGENHLGRILMEARDYHKRTQNGNGPKGRAGEGSDRA